MKILKKTLLFLFLAVPGVLIFQFSFLILIMPLFITTENLGIHPVYLILALLLGGVMILWGTGRQKQWRFLIIFLLVPLAMLAFSYFSNGLFPSITLLSTLLVVFWFSSRIHKHYRLKKEKKERKENSPTPDDQDHPTFPIE